jgi:HAD superfamily hydrolase (TIGR01509 family)
MSEHPANARRLEAVTFDMDGLLIDSEPLWFRAESAVIDRLHGSWAHGDQDVLVGGSMSMTVAHLLSKATVPAEPAVVAGWLLDAMVDLLTTGPVRVLPGVLELVADVQAVGLPYALVTSSEPEVVTAALATLDVAFPVIVCAADVSQAKPDPEGYLLAAAKLGVDPQRAIALEDSVNGVLAAEAAGFRTVAVPSVVPVRGKPGRIVLDTLAGVTLAQLTTIAGLTL